MLAPWCERESAGEPVLQMGRSAADWWENTLPGHVVRAGTLVVAPARDAPELARFSGRTTGHEPVDEAGVAALEPDLAGRFTRGLFFAGEAHLDPRRVLPALRQRLSEEGVRFHFDAGKKSSCMAPADHDVVADCTGMARAAVDPRLRGVRGEMLVLKTGDVNLSRPVRLLHPRIPVYVVPRSGNRFMVGATMIESSHGGPVTARSVMELLNAAYSLHPAFGEAEIVETGAGVRPAFPDNLPGVEREGRQISINGLYRHGFLLAPAMARRAVDLLFAHFATGEVLHEACR
jgi:glycine oxidase